MPHASWRIGAGPAKALVVLLHGLDHGETALAPIARAAVALRNYLDLQGGPRAPGLFILSPDRGDGGGTGPATLGELVERHCAPLAAQYPQLPIVTVGESLGAAIAHEWAHREPRIVHQIHLDPFPMRLPLRWRDRALVRLTMALQRASFRLRRLGLDVTAALDRALIDASVDPVAREDRRDHVRFKCAPEHVGAALREAALISRLARGAPPELRPKPACTTTVFLPPEERSLAGALMARIAQAAVAASGPVRLYRSNMGGHFNLAEMASAHIAWDLASAVGPLPDLSGDGFARWYWAGLGIGGDARARLPAMTLVLDAARALPAGPAAAPVSAGV